MHFIVNFVLFLFLLDPVFVYFINRYEICVLSDLRNITFVARANDFFFLSHVVYFNIIIFYILFLPGKCILLKEQGTHDYNKFQYLSHLSFSIKINGSRQSAHG